MRELDPGAKKNNIEFLTQKEKLAIAFLFLVADHVNAQVFIFIFNNSDFFISCFVALAGATSVLALYDIHTYLNEDRK